MKSVQSTADAMREEAAWLHSVGTRLESLANELEGKDPQAALEAVQKVELARPAPRPAPELRLVQAADGPEYVGLTRKAAIQKALGTYGPQTTTDLLARLRAGGLPDLTRQQLSVAISNCRRAREVLRGEDNVNRLNEASAIAL